MKLFEVFDSTAKLGSSKFYGDYMSQYFSVNKKLYRVAGQLSNNTRKIWDVDFVQLVMIPDKPGELEDRYDMTGSGDEFVVVSTVYNILVNFFLERMKENEVGTIQFCASIEDRSRVRLYDRMVNKLAKQFGFVVESEVDSTYNEKEYRLKNPDFIIGG